MLSAEDITGLYAIIPTPATADANRMDAKDTVDLAETERLINALLRDGVDGLIVLGTTGECATLTQAEFEAFTDCVARTVDRRVPLFIGATALGGHQVAERLAFVQELGADGTLLGLPMWQPCTQAMAVKYYREVAELYPNLALMVYANARAFRFDFPLAFWAELAKAVPSVVAAKYSRLAGLRELVTATGKRINFVPNDNAAHKFFDASPETTIACWATAASMGPAPSVAMARAIRDRDGGRVAAVAKDIAWANEPVSGIVSDPEIFASYNIQIEKLRIEAAGYCKPGPMRPPYDVIPPDYAEAARACGRRWAEICKRYAN